MMPAHDPNLTNMWLSFFLLFVIAGLTAYYADKKGRNSFTWFILGLLLGVIAPIVLFFLSNLKKEKEIENSTTPTMTVYPPSHQMLPSETQEEPKQLALTEDNKLWYYLDDNHHQYGPVSLIALKDLWNTGQLNLNSYVWSEGMQQWEIVDSLPHLKEALKTFHG